MSTFQESFAHKRHTQTDLIFNALSQGRRITPLEALNEFGCMRLAAAIHSLKKEGHNIETELIEVGTKDGRTTKVAEYHLVIQDQGSLF